MIEAESKEEALERVENRYALYNYDEQICTGTLDDVRYMMKLLGKCWKNENLEFELELSKYVTNQIIIRKQANDDIDQPKDYEEEK